jgi:hypothetical protein
MNTIRMPIRFSKQTFEMETIDENSDEYYATLVANAIQIESKELPISTYFGVIDPVFDERQTNRTISDASRYIPEITIRKVTTNLNDDGTRNISVSFERG